MKNIIIFCFAFISLSLFSCEKKNVHSDSLEGGVYRVVAIEGTDPGQDSVFENLYGCDITFNICLSKMNDAWGTKKEKKGDCQMMVSSNAKEWKGQDEYRFHLMNDDMLEIKWLETHYEKNRLPDLSGRYSFTLDGKNMVMVYEGDKKEWEGLEIHCQDWSPL